MGGMRGGAHGTSFSTLGMLEPSKACALYAFLNSMTALSCRSSLALHPNAETPRMYGWYGIVLILSYGE